MTASNSEEEEKEGPGWATSGTKPSLGFWVCERWRWGGRVLVCDGGFEGVRKERKLQREDEAAMDDFEDCGPSDFGVISCSSLLLLFSFFGAILCLSFGP